MARKMFSKELKARVGLEALRGEKTVAQLSSEYGVHATQINAWRKQALEGLPDLFERANGADAKAQEAEKEQPYQQDGQASSAGRLAEKKVQAVGLELSVKRALVEPDMSAPSIRRQCELIGLNRSSWYAQEAPATESEEKVALMRRIDETYTAHPFYGSRQMTAVLRREGQAVNRKRVRRLMQLMGLQSLAPGPDTSRAHPAHPVYPYLAHGISWCSGRIRCGPPISRIFALSGALPIWSP
jgi:putative transposase